MNTDHNCLKIVVRPTDYHRGDGQLKLSGITPQSSLDHLFFFVPQLVVGGDTNDCWDFGDTKHIDAAIDALISEGVFPAAVVQQITDWGFMDIGSDGNPHFHSSERWAGILSNLGRNGGSIYTGYDIYRNYGIVPFKLLPVSTTMTLEEYFDPTAITPALKDIGLQFLALMGGKNFCQYQWVNDGGVTNLSAMAAAFKETPLLDLGIPVSSTGWNQVYPTIATGAAVHVVTAYAPLTGLNKPNDSVPISDNYPPFLKVLGPGQQISYVMQMFVQYIPPAPAPVPAPATPIPAAPVLPANPTPQQELTWLNALPGWLRTVLTILGIKSATQGKVGTSSLNIMDSFNFSFLKSGTFWSSFVTVLGIIFTALSQQYPNVSWIGVAVSILSIISANYLHKNAVLQAAKSSATLGKVVSGQ